MREIFKLLQYLCYCLTNFDKISRGKAYSPSRADEWPKVLRILKSKLVDDGQLENGEKFQFSTNVYPKTAKKVQITVFTPN